MIDVQSLTYTYPHHKDRTIKGIGFSIKKGEIFGFLGPSGAGKSTTQKILIGLLKGYSGSVKVLGEEIRTTNSEFYEKIGVAFEFPNFYSKFTALENLKHFQRFYSVETIDPLELLSSVGLEKDANTKVGSFSKGMKMRLNFIRAFMNKPEVIFLDEPTSGLDPVNARLMKEKILQLKSDGKTIIITTHHMMLAQEICDRVAFIVDGQISLIDSPKKLMLQKSKKSVKIEYEKEGAIRTSEFLLNELKTNRSFQDILQNEYILSIHTEEASLEDIFIEITGRSLS
ncbi:ABC transporter ATP-binding protein [Bacillus sp. 03113]|uniref:ABC transporter ATP-binding protein n=1 Tax=Bacillus sp. 03113 TaxID=2578211 RepID=UPI001143B5AB|nr:ABC transporter ATP-binding protein [Bacillus sp. 03113]